MGPETGQTHVYAGDDPVNEGDPAGLASASFISADGGGGPSCSTIQDAFEGTHHPTTSMETLQLNAAGCLGWGGSEGSGGFHLGGWETFLVGVGTVAGVVAFVSGIGELAAAGFVAEEGGDAAFLGVSAATYGEVSTAAGLTAVAADAPSCGEAFLHPNSSTSNEVLACVGVVANGFSAGLAAKAGEVTSAELPAIQGLMKALAAAGGAGTTAWDFLSSLEADVGSPPTGTTTTTPPRHVNGLMMC